MMFLRKRTEGNIRNPGDLRFFCSVRKQQVDVVVYSHLLTRAQCELLISRRSTQYPIIGLPLSFGSFQVTNMLVAVISSICGLSGASGGSEIRKSE